MINSTPGTANQNEKRGTYPEPGNQHARNCSSDRSHIANQRIQSIPRFLSSISQTQIDRSRLGTVQTVQAQEVQEELIKNVYAAIYGRVFIYIAKSLYPISRPQHTLRPSNRPLHLPPKTAPSMEKSAHTTHLYIKCFLQTSTGAIQRHQLLELPCDFALGISNELPKRARMHM